MNWLSLIDNVSVPKVKNILKIVWAVTVATILNGCDVHENPDGSYTLVPEGYWDNHPPHPTPSHPENSPQEQYHISFENLANAPVQLFSRKTGRLISSFTTDLDCNGHINASDFHNFDPNDEIIVEVSGWSFEEWGCWTQVHWNAIEWTIRDIWSSEQVHGLRLNTYIEEEITKYEVIFNGILLWLGSRNVGTLNGTRWRDYKIDEYHYDTVLDQRKKAVSEALESHGNFEWLDVWFSSVRRDVISTLEQNFNPFFVYEMIDEDGNIWLQGSKWVRFDNAGNAINFAFSFDGHNWIDATTMSCIWREDLSGYCAQFWPNNNSTIYTKAPDTWVINQWTIWSKR